MWFFGKDKKDKKKGKGGASAPTKPKTSKEVKTQALLAQMRDLRAEIGEENLQNIVRKLKLDELKNQVRHDIDHNPEKRDRLLDEIRYHVHDHDRDKDNSDLY